MLRWLPALLIIGCGQPEAGPNPLRTCGSIAADAHVDAPATRCALETEALIDHASAETSFTLGVFVATTRHAPRDAWDIDTVQAVLRDALDETVQILAACDIRPRLESAAVFVVPDGMQTVEGNASDSWGGLAPPNEDDPDIFNYLRDERLAPEPRALFSLARQTLPDNALAVVIVDDIIYHEGQKPKRAGGLSFAPIVFHHADDFPARNSVLTAAAYARDGEAPVRVHGRHIAHELGHMLLNTGTHYGETEHNLMHAGRDLDPAQCDTMRDNLATLYGDPAIIDPLQP